MSVQIHVPMAGLLRVIFFIALVSAVTIFVISLVTSVYEGPGEGVSSRVTSVLVDDTEANYNRNLGIIYSLISGALSAVAILGLRSNLNALRCGLLAAGLGVFFAGFGYATSGSSDWLVAVWSLLATIVLLASARYLEDGASFALMELPGIPRA
jgi:hypothetical protein